MTTSGSYRATRRSAGTALRCSRSRSTTSWDRLNHARRRPPKGLVNATTMRLCLAGRECLVRLALREQWPARRVAAACWVSVRTARKWITCFHGEGPTGLQDRSARPRYCPRRVARPSSAGSRSSASSAGVGRRSSTRWSSPSPVGNALQRLGLNRLPPYASPAPVVHHARAPREAVPSTRSGSGAFIPVWSASDHRRSHCARSAVPHGMGDA